MRNYSLWAFLPPIYSLSTAAGLWVVYIVAVTNEKITPLGSKYRGRNGSLYPPYISIAGNYPPASCIFSEVMNLAAFVGLMIAVLRYLQLKHRIHKPWLNIVSLVVFCVSCFGMTLIGNFQLFAEEMIHNLGTNLTFGLGTGFCWLQSYITLKVDLKNEGKKAGILRFVLSGCITVCMVPYFSLMSQGLHMHAARCQWALVMFLLLYLSTFAIEFRHFSFDIVCREICPRHASLPEVPTEACRSEPDRL